MSLKKFLWWFSFSVFLAGLVYRYAGPLGLFEERGGRSPAYAGDIVGGSHRPDDRLVSPVVGRHSSFWFLTAADRAVSYALIFGTGLVSEARGERDAAYSEDAPTNPDPDVR